MKEAVVNEGLIAGLVNDPAARSKFQFLRRAHQMLVPSRRSCCGRRARSALNVQAVKLTILGMAGTELQKLKAHLGVEKLVFFMADRGGGTARLER